MRPVNLLPEQDRPYTPSGALQGSAYVVVAALGLFLVALVAYVLTANQVTDRRAEADQAKQEAAAAEARAARLGNFASFSQMKETRETSVKTLAVQRFDWERLSLELARVLPSGVFATDVTASVSGDDAPGTPSAGGSSSSSSTKSSSGTKSSGASSSTSGASSAPGGATASAAPDPTMTLTACAPRQRDVATTMVRLRNMHRAKDVKLVESVRGEVAENTGGSQSGAPAAGNPEDCGSSHGHGNFRFVVKVEFKAAEAGAEKAPDAPRTLGGGA